MIDQLQKEKIYSGTSGLVLPIPKKSFPHEFGDKSRLSYYASLFNSIEINSSFYKIPLAKTISRWATEVPENFRFTFKLWRGITHNKGLEYSNEDINKFMQVISNVGDKKGSLLIQFPPGLQNNYMYRLEDLLTSLHEADPRSEWPLAVEFRNRTWYNDEVYQLLEKFDAGLVLHDLPASNTPFMDISASFVYLRFHGPQGGYRGSYSSDFLNEYAHYINEWTEEDKTVYVYFNNTAGDALNNLITLNKLLKNLT
jgi:uncharacterized protein YecE (DUF72 family)